MQVRSIDLVCVVLFTFLLVACSQQNNAKTNELKNKISQLEQKVNQLQSENDSLRRTSTNVQSTEQKVTLGGGQSSGSPAAPTHYFGEILTKNGNRIKVEQFGKEAGDKYSAYKIRGVYKDQKITIEWKDLKRIWITGRIIHYHGGPDFPESLDLELNDGRHYRIEYKDLDPSGMIPYITINEVTNARSLQYVDLSKLVVIAINGRLESLNYCTNCKKYFPDIYKYCNKCGGELHFQNVPE